MPKRAIRVDSRDFLDHFLSVDEISRSTKTHETTEPYHLAMNPFVC